MPTIAVVVYVLTHISAELGGIVCRYLIMAKKHKLRTHYDVT